MSDRLANDMGASGRCPASQACRETAYRPWSRCPISEARCPYIKVLDSHITALREDLAAELAARVATRPAAQAEIASLMLGKRTDRSLTSRRMTARRPGGDPLVRPIRAARRGW